MKHLLWIFLTLAFLIQQSSASSCCGSSVSLPALITTGERWKFQTVLSQSERVFEIKSNSDAIRLDRKNQLSVFKTQLKMGYLFDNNWQVFSQISYLDRGMGDIDFGVGREVSLSDEFSTYVWAQMTVPTGKSIYELEKPNEQPTGSGFWTPGIGISLTKTLRTWDFSTAAYVGQGLTQKIKGQTIEPGLKSYAQVSTGKSFGNWRTGLSLEYQRENGKNIKQNAKAEDSYSWPVSASISYMDKSDIWTASYTDETLLGPTKNTYLNHGVSVSYVRRFF